jgi:hypothetical protein
MLGSENRVSDRYTRTSQYGRPLTNQFDYHRAAAETLEIRQRFACDRLMQQL